MKYLLSILCLSASLHGFAQRQDTFQVYFPLNEQKVTKQGSDYIDKLIFGDILIHGQKLIVLGYADYVGDTKHNDALSKARAKSVQDYLISMGFSSKDITLCIGKGKIDRPGMTSREGFTGDRKVQIVIDRTPPPAPPPPSAPKPAVAPKQFADIEKVKVNETVALKDINFIPGLAMVLPESTPELDRLYNFMNEHKTVIIKIEGHICCKTKEEGTDEPYLGGTLSEFRAKTIYDYLVKRGIEKKRMSYVGLGTTDPLVFPEQSEEDQKANRRVEVRILSK